MLYLSQGLCNYGDTCYVNALAQCIAHCVPLAKSLLTTDAKGVGNALRRLVAHMWLRRKCSTSLASIVKFAKETIGHGQQDAGELLVILLDRINYLQSVTCMHKLQGVRCGFCRKSSFSKENTSILFTQFYQDSGSLQDAVNSHFADEEIDGWKCEKCGRTAGDADTPLVQRRSVLAPPLPKVVIVSLGRFRMSPTGALYKDVRNATCEDDIYISSGRRTRQAKQKYVLQGVLCHRGRSMHGGHYYAICKHPQSSEWICYDDETVTMRPDLQTTSFSSSDAYIAFYTQSPN